MNKLSLNIYKAFGLKKDQPYNVYLHSPKEQDSIKESQPNEPEGEQAELAAYGAGVAYGKEDEYGLYDEYPAPTRNQTSSPMEAILAAAKHVNSTGSWATIHHPLGGESTLYKVGDKIYIKHIVHVDVENKKYNNISDNFIRDNNQRMPSDKRLYHLAERDNAALARLQNYVDLNNSHSSNLSPDMQPHFPEIHVDTKDLNALSPESHTTEEARNQARSVYPDLYEA